MSAALLDLPLASWAARFGDGTAELRARLPAPTARLPAGPVRVELAFRGGASSTVHAARVGAETFAEGEAGGVVRELLGAAHDLSVVATARVGAPLVVALAPGVALTVPAGATVHVRGATTGPAEHPRLTQPVVLVVDGAGLTVGVPADRLHVLPALHIHEVSLAPDGEVGLRCRREWRLSGLTNGSLRPIARQLTELVRHSPRTADIRAWLGPMTR